MFRFDDVENFINIYSKRKENIETKDISNWVGCSNRYIQKLASQCYIPYLYNHGRKSYIWNEKSIKYLAAILNSKTEKIKVEKQKPTNEKPEIKSDVISIYTIKDLVNDYVMKSEDKLGAIRKLQIWAKKNDIDFEYRYGRKYYIINDEVKSQMIKLI